MLRTVKPATGGSMKVSLFYLPSLGSKADIEAGMAGMRPDLY